MKYSRFFYLFTFGFSIFVLGNIAFSDGADRCQDGIAAEVWAEGIRLVRSGKANEALILFCSTRTEDSPPIDCQQKMDDLYNIIELQDLLATESNIVLWFSYAEKLRSYYLAKGMFLEGYEIGRQIFSRIKTAANGIEVVDTCLMFQQVDTALSFTQYLETEFAKEQEALTVVNLTKCNVLLAAGKSERARCLVRDIHFDSVKTPELFLRLAKVQVATRQYASSVKSLVRYFELTPPQSLPAVKAKVLDCLEFKWIASSSEFKSAMATKSTLSEGCAGCAVKWIKTERQ